MHCAAPLWLLMEDKDANTINFRKTDPMKNTLFAALLAGSALTGLASAQAAEKQAIFAGGCFWCIEKDFEHVAGVKEVVSGYMGGTNENPTYKNHTQFGHREVVRITYDDATVSYADLLATFFRTVDPTDGGGQFCDRGHSYSTAIYTLNDEQMAEAKAAKADAADALKAEIATEITPAPEFTAAEDYHQNYYEKNPGRYTYYRFACGRDKKVKQLWGDMAYQGVDKTS